ncbi:MAG: ribonuclease HII [Christensenellaceae bacterium]|nr:ribonuclease HII [Christensenellaceae bacterium]
MNKIVIGVDEVGAGPLAGPLCVCAAAIDEGKIRVEGVTDSKKLTPIKREILFPLIEESIIGRSIIWIEPHEVDEINIYEARRKAMALAIDELLEKLNKLNYRGEEIEVKVDGGNLHLKTKNDLQIEYIIKGDEREYAIGCASIIAKVERDRLMIGLADEYVQYGFERHKGYGTKEHIKAIREFGLCGIHRKSFCRKFMKGKNIRA